MNIFGFGVVNRRGNLIIFDMTIHQNSLVSAYREAVREVSLMGLPFEVKNQEGEMISRNIFGSLIYSADRVLLERDLRAALCNNEFVLHC